MKASSNIVHPAGSLRSLSRRQVAVTVAGVMLAMFMSSLDQTVVGTAMPKIIVDLGGFSHYTWVTTAYIVASTVVMPITGKVTDMFGRKAFFIAGIIVFTVASALCGLSNSMAQIIAFRGLQGIGAGIIMANAFTVIGDLFPPAERGKYQGLISGVFGISSVVGPTLGGFITDTISWHWVFFINVPLGVAIVVLFFVFFPNLRPQPSRYGVDYAGVAALVLAVVPAMLALSWAGVEFSWLSWQILGLFLFSFCMGVVFIWIESRSREPIIPLGLFKERIVTVSMLVVLFTGFGMFGGIVFIPLFFQGVLGLSATASGNFLTPMMLGVVVGGLVSGQLLSRAGGHYKGQGIFGLVLMVVGMGLLSRMSVDTSYGQAVLNIVLIGIGLGTLMPIYTIAVQNAVEYRLLGVATSLTAFFRSIGGALGLAIFGSVMTNRFASGFMERLPQALKTAMPPAQLESLAHNPQALVSVEAQAKLGDMLGRLGAGGTALLDQVLLALRQALESALGLVFFLGLVATVLALVIHLFIKEIPLRKEHMPVTVENGGEGGDGVGSGR